MSQLVFSYVDKTGDKALDVWFDIAAYISNDHDGVQSYYEKHAWLKTFILPTDLSTSSHSLHKASELKYGGITDDLRDAKVEFEVRPLEFIQHIEEFSGIMETRDLCNLLIRHLGKSRKEEKTDENLRYWLWLQTEVMAINSSRTASIDNVTYSADADIPKQIQSSIRRYRETGPEFPYNTTASQFEAYVKRSTEKEELERREIGTVMLTDISRIRTLICLPS